MASVGLRAYIQFGDSMDPRMAKAFTLLTMTFITNMVVYFHNSVTRFHLGLPGLLVRFALVYLRNFGLVGVLSFSAVAGCMYYVAQVIREQLSIHGTPTGHLSLAALPQRSPPPSMTQLPQHPPLADAGKKPSWQGWAPDPHRRPSAGIPRS